MEVEYEKQGRIAILTLNRPEARNAVNGALARRMEEILDDYEADPELWVAILTANGSAFCAGADLKEIAAGRGPELGTIRGGFSGIVMRERTKPLIAAIAGSALAGGTEIALRALAARVMAAAPIAVQQSRGVAVRAFTDDDPTLWRAGAKAFLENAKTQDFQEGPRAFIEKRAPRWTGR
jgi:enoyl-CoA hydratase/carnithine racemase